MSSSSSLQTQSYPLQEYCVCHENPSSIYYVPNFLPPGFGGQLWTWLLALPTNHDTASPTSGCWHDLPHAKRRVALFDGTTTVGTAADGNSMFPTPLQLIVNALVEANVFPAHDNEVDDGDGPPNHILINHYESHQGIMPHTDGPAYYSRTATISLGDGQVLLDFTPRRQGREESPTSEQEATTTLAQQRQVLLEGGGSLVVFEKDAYLEYMHSIAEQQHSHSGGGGGGDGDTKLFGQQQASENCCNASVGTAVERRERISLTIRRKKMATAPATQNGDSS